MLWDDDTQRAGTRMVVIDGQSTWTAYKGIRLGLPLAALEKAERQAVQAHGLREGRHGHGQRWNGGALGLLTDGCKVAVQLKPDPKAAAGTLKAAGSNKEFASSDPAIPCRQADHRRDHRGVLERANRRVGENSELTSRGFSSNFSRFTSATHSYAQIRRSASCDGIPIRSRGRPNTGSGCGARRFGREAVTFACRNRSRGLRRGANGANVMTLIKPREPN